MSILLCRKFKKLNHEKFWKVLEFFIRNSSWEIFRLDFSGLFLPLLVLRCSILLMDCPLKSWVRRLRTGTVPDRFLTCFHDCIRRRRTLSGFCPDLLWGVCRSKSGSNSKFGHSKTSRLKISEFDWQTPHSKSGQNPDSAVHRLLNCICSFFANFLILKRNMQIFQMVSKRQCKWQINMQSKIILQSKKYFKLQFHSILRMLTNSLSKKKFQIFCFLTLFSQTDSQVIFLTLFLCQV